MGQVTGEDVLTANVLIWVLPESKKLLVDGFHGGPPVETSGWSEETRQWLKGLFGYTWKPGWDTWDEACAQAKIMQEKAGDDWEIDYLPKNWMALTDEEDW